jgi:YD repeat-containing protein
MNDPDMGNWTYEYDLNGNLINQTDARGISTLLSYDALDRLTAIDYPNDEDVSFTYDLQYNGTLSQITRGGVSSSYEYDQRYRVENETVTLDGTGYTTSYEYDSMDRPTITYPGGNSVDLTYNAQTLLESVEGVVDNLDYNARNQITTKELSNGVVTTYTYDAEKLLLDRIYTESLQDLNYEFDNVGNILEIEDNVMNSVKTYGYDDLDRLTSADMSVNSVPTYQRDFTYDQYGCIQQVDENSITISSYEYNLTPFHAPDTYNGNILDYDANGNLVRMKISSMSTTMPTNYLRYATLITVPLLKNTGTMPTARESRNRILPVSSATTSISSMRLRTVLQPATSSVMMNASQRKRLGIWNGICQIILAVPLCWLTRVGLRLSVLNTIHMVRFSLEGWRSMGSQDRRMMLTLN